MATCPRRVFGMTPNAPLWIVVVSLATDIRGCADVSIICSRALPEYVLSHNTA